VPATIPRETENDYPTAADQHDRRGLGDWLEDNGNTYGDILPIDPCDDDGIPVRIERDRFYEWLKWNHSEGQAKV
jgi:hypothetical protein